MPEDGPGHRWQHAPARRPELLADIAHLRTLCAHARNKDKGPRQTVDQRGGGGFYRRADNGTNRSSFRFYSGIKVS